jgi:hypothetical protein
MEISIRDTAVTVLQHISDTTFVSLEYTMRFFFGNSLALENKNKVRLTALQPN